MFGVVVCSNKMVFYFFFSKVLLLSNNVVFFFVAVVFKSSPILPLLHLVQEMQRYGSNLDDAKAFGMRKGFVNGGSMGVVYFLLFCSYALAFWYGSILVEDGINTPGDIITVSRHIASDIFLFWFQKNILSILFFSEEKALLRLFSASFTLQYVFLNASRGFKNEPATIFA